MTRATERRRQAGTRTSVAHRALALLLAGLTGCYTTSTSRIPHQQVEEVERLPAGTHLTLTATEVEPGLVAVAAEEQAMCRDEERGTRTWTIRSVSTKGRSGSGGGPGLGGCGGGGGGFALVCLGILVAVLVVVIPVAIIVSQLPKTTTSEEPSGEPAEPYREWQGERTSCNEWVRSAPGLPLRLVTRLNPTACLEWRTATAEDGTLALLPALDRTRAAVVPCDGSLEPGLLRIEPLEAATASPGAEEPPATQRTHDELLVPLWPPAAEALGFATTEQALAIGDGP